MSFLRLPTIGKVKFASRKRQYEASLLTKAYEEVTVNGAPIFKAARMYGIPDSTLRDRFRGPFQPAPQGESFNIRPGPSTTFTFEEECKLVDHSTYMASIGHGYSRSEFINLANDYAVSLKKKSPSDPIFAQSWYDGFKKRHPEITLSKPQKLSVLRAKFTSEDALDKYFDALIKVMTPYGLEDKPENIWNVDETGLQMEHSPTNVVCQKGSTPQAITSNRAKTVTMIAAGSAVGTYLPPFYVFPGKRWNDDLLAGACPGAGGTVSETGWSNSQIFLQYLEKHFLKYAPTNDSPILILFDGHKSHVNLTLKEWGVEHNVIFFVLPPHTSHVTQPLNVGCFGPLKKIFFSECQSFMRNTPGIQINRLHIASISSKAYNKAMTPDNLVSSFRKTGIFPLERKQISPIKTAPSSIYNTETNEDNSTNETETPKNFLDQRKEQR